MSITLPPLPNRSCIVTYMGDGRGLHYTLGVAAGTALIEQPPGSQLDLYTADQLRARDQEIARLVLKGVAAEIRKWGDDSRAAKDEHVALFCQITAASVEKLEVRHHE